MRLFWWNWNLEHTSDCSGKAHNKEKLAIRACSSSILLMILFHVGALRQLQSFSLHLQLWVGCKNLRVPFFVFLHRTSSFKAFDLVALHSCSAEDLKWWKMFFVVFVFFRGRKRNSSLELVKQGAKENQSIGLFTKDFQISKVVIEKNRKIFTCFTWPS